MSTPARDIAMILYTSVMPETREENKFNLLEIYCQSLRSTCEMLGYVGKAPDVNEMKSYLEKISYWTAIISLCSLPVFLSSNVKDYKKEVEKFIEPEGNKQAKSSGVIRKEYYRINVIEKALKFEVQRCMDKNII